MTEQTEQTRHNDFNTTQITKWLEGTIKVSSSERFFKLEDGSIIRVGSPVRFTGEAAGIPKGKVVVKELRVAKYTHQVMVGLEYEGDLFFYHVCDFSALVAKTPLPPEWSPTQGESDILLLEPSDNSPEPTASFKAYGLTEIFVGGVAYLLTEEGLLGVHNYLVGQGIYSRNIGG